MSSAESREPRLPLGEALALGALQGLTELLPVSSSGHLALVPRWLGWRYTRLSPDVRKTFEVALHAGTAAALLLVGRRELSRAVRHPRLLALACGPPALAGYLLERPIERCLDTPAATAVGLVAGSGLMAASERRPGRRRCRDARPSDALWLGVAQAAALAPGVSRSGATLAVARLRGFRPADAGCLSRQAGLPVLAGASALKTIRLKDTGLQASLRTPFLLGAAAAFSTTLASLRRPEAAAGTGSLLPWAVYRVALAGAVAASQARLHS